MSSPTVRPVPLLLCALAVGAGLLRAASAQEYRVPLIAGQLAGNPVELDWNRGEVRRTAPTRIFDSIPRLALRNDGAEVDAAFLHDPDDASLDDWFPRANNDPLDADLTLVAMPLLTPLGISNIRFRSEYGTDFDNNRRIGGQLLATGRGWVGMDTAWDYREIDLPAGKENEFWSGDANIVARLPEVMMLNMRAGAGVNWLHDRGETDLGYNLTYAADVFVKQPWLLSSEIDWGQVGSEDLLHFRITLGLVLGTMEVFGGYDYYDVGSMELDGLVGGVGLWF